jgi:hypothetical protein
MAFTWVAIGNSAYVIVGIAIIDSLMTRKSSYEDLLNIDVYYNY